MIEVIEFSGAYKYDTLLVGITVPVFLSDGELTTAFKAKIDTGASYCIFERKHGEMIGLEIEGGDEIRISTATGYFTAYEHKITLSVLSIEAVSTVYFAKEEGFTRNVLDRQGWLDRLKLGLIAYEGKLLLSVYDK